MPPEANQTDTTSSETQTTTETHESGTVAEGGVDASQSTVETSAGDDDTTLVGGATTDTGDGDGGETGDTDTGEGETTDGETGPPEAYDLKVEVTGEDGKAQAIEIDKALLDKATPLFKDIGLTNEQANKLAPLVLDVQDRLVQQQSDDHTALKTAWAKEAKNDPEIGGAKWKETEALMGRALDTFGAKSAKDADGKETNEFRALLNESGLGNHPVMVRMFREIGLKVGEDGDLIRGDANRQVKKDPEVTLYPDDQPKVKG